MVETGNKFHDNVSRLLNWAHWFTFFNLIIVSLISLRYIAYAGISDSGLGIAYQFISLIGHFSFLCAVVFGLLLFPLAFVVPYQRLYRFFAILISTIAITFLIVDTQIFRLYEFHLTPLIWQFLQQPEQVEKIYSINLHYISIPIIFVIEFVISFFAWRKCRQLQAKKIGKPISIILFSIFVVSHLTYIWADAKQYRPITQQKSLYPLSYPMTARTFLTKQGWLSDDKLQQRIIRQQGSSSSELEYPKQPLTYLDNVSGEDKNIVVITVEALRADLLNDKNMPFTNTLTQQGLNFTQHFSGASTRAQGIFSLFYGLPNRYWSEVTLNFISPVLMDRLQEKNYQFGLFSSIGFFYPEFLQSSFSQIDTPELHNFTVSNSNSNITKKWKKWFNNADSEQKQFSFLYYHQAGDALALDDNNFSLAQRSQKMQRYQQQVLDIDQEINKVITTLKDENQLDNTIVIITGSHGASFEKEESAQAAINNAHVPLIMLWPGQPSRSIARMTSHVDIAPTIMEEALGVQTSAAEYSNGQNLFDNKDRPYILSGDLKKYVIYEKDKITTFDNDGDISSIDWQGIAINEDEFDITLLIDVLSQLRQFKTN
jgi:membrane-anchored protein YejM (alkaline phosphatase superfamily)